MRGEVSNGLVIVQPQVNSGKKRDALATQKTGRNVNREGQRWTEDRERSRVLMNSELRFLLPSVGHRPYLTWLIVSAGLHAQALWLAVRTAGAEASFVIGTDQVADQSVVPVLGVASTTYLHHWLVISNSKATSRGLQCTAGGDRPSFHWATCTSSDAAYSGQTTAITFYVVMLSSCSHHDRAGPRRRAAGRCWVDFPDRCIVGSNFGL